MSRHYTRALLLIYGLLNAALYSSLVPLWEGIDEEFHYGYVQYLGAHNSFPVMGRTGLSEEINESLGLVPMSYVMIQNQRLQNFPEIRSFAQYFALDSAQRHQLRDRAERIPPDLRLQDSARYNTNYEAQHAPLTYILMAIPNYFILQVPLPQRVFVLRLLVATASVLLMFRGILALGIETRLNETFTAILIFLTFSCQMFWATVAHVCNDWLAVPLAVWLIGWTLRCHRQPTVRAAVWLGIVLAAGLLSKAYFLVFVPLYLLCAVVWFRKGSFRARGWAALFGIPLALAGPWYARNLMLYGNLSGRLGEANGMTVGSPLQSLVSVPWLKSIPFMVRGAFWMGNCSFTDFSVSTMNALLVLLGIALILNVRKSEFRRDVFLWAPVVLFCAAMIFDTASLYTYTNGSEKVTGPWYLQAVMTPLLCMAMLGCQRSGRLGRWIAAATVALWSYIMAATYLAKLFPLYGGFQGGRSTLRDLLHWYLSEWPRTADILNTTAMAPATVLVTLLAILLLALLMTAAAMLAAIVHNEHRV